MALLGTSGVRGNVAKTPKSRHKSGVTRTNHAPVDRTGAPATPASVQSFPFEIREPNPPKSMISTSTPKTRPDAGRPNTKKSNNTTQTEEASSPPEAAHDNLTALIVGWALSRRQMKLVDLATSGARTYVFGVISGARRGALHT